MVSSFYERLSELLFDSKTDKKLIAKELDIDISQIYKYLRDTHMPNFKNAIKIAEYFNCSFDYLFGLKDDYARVNYKELPAFSEQFKGILKENKISKYYLNKKTNTPNQRISDWISGKRMPSMQNLILIAKTFNWSLDYIIGNE